MDCIQYYESPLGGITVAADGEAMIGLWFDHQKYFAATLNNKEHKIATLPVLEEAFRWLDVYFSGEIPDFTPALHLRGTELRKNVWNILLSIPYGQTVTYGEITERVARERGMKRMAAQAIGSAIGHNPISLIIPCHRVIGADGSLKGYAGGLDKKAALLKLEGVNPSLYNN